MLHEDHQIKIVMIKYVQTITWIITICKVIYAVYPMKYAHRAYFMGYTACITLHICSLSHEICTPCIFHGIYSIYNLAYGNYLTLFCILVVNISPHLVDSGDTFIHILRVVLRRHRDDRASTSDCEVTMMDMHKIYYYQIPTKGKCKAGNVCIYLGIICIPLFNRD